MSPARFHPVVARWFADRFPSPTPAQQRGWPAIAAGRDTLIAAPTGSGKTLAAFLWCLDRLARRAFADDLSPQLDTLYLSPLKALGNDIERNLRAPLDGIREGARAVGLPPPDIRVAVRSGDTPSSARARMVRTPPHILITTPESLYILLTSRGGRRMLSTVRTVIVDEIHAVAANKRGSHLALSLERLDALCAHGPGDADDDDDAAPWVPRPAPVRVGLSATQKPIERLARLLVGTRRPRPTIVDAGHSRPLDIAIDAPEDELCAVASRAQMAQVYDRMAALVTAHRTTLVFTNTRRMAERVAHQLELRIGSGAVAAHHGSVARDKRLDAERRLQAAELKCVVATASLELGIDVGDVELVIQLGSPRCIATFLQRVGRAGHWVGGTPKGRLFAVTRDQAVECAALIRAVRSGELDAIELIDAPLDILAQQIVAEVAGRAQGEDALFEMVRGALPYADLPRATFDGVVEMLAEGVATRRGRSTAHLHRDRVNRRLAARRGARLAAITGGGAIPDRADYTVIAEPDEAVVGTVDEDFAIESPPGSVFLLGNTPWRIRRVESSTVRVEAAPGATPNIPFWFGEAPARTRELSAAVGRLRDDVDRRLAAGRGVEAIARWLGAETGLPPRAATLVTQYLAASRVALGTLPTHRRLVAERFFDEGGGMQLVVHAPLGGRINRAWGLALRKRFCVSFDFELQAAATDDGLVISLGPQHSFPLATVFDFVTPSTAAPVLQQAVLTNPPLLGTRWRWTATRGLAVLRWRSGKRVPAPILRMKADDLLAAVFPGAAACQENVHGPIEPPDHPLVHETLADIMRDFMDLDGLVEVLEGIVGGDIEIHAVDTAEASPLSHELLNANPYAFLDDAPLEERRSRAVAMRRRLRLDPDGLGALDAGAIAEVVAQARPPMRDADELHDALLGWGYWIPEAPDASTLAAFAALVERRRAVLAEWPDGSDAIPAHAPDDSSAAVDGSNGIWVASERVAWVRRLIPDAVFAPPPPALSDGPMDEDADAIAKAVVQGHLETTGPHTAGELSARLRLPRATVEAALLGLEADGNILRGRFRPGAADEEWCPRGLLARIHRRTLGRLRAAVEPVSAADFMRFLFAWHGVAPVGDPAAPRRDDPRRVGLDALADVVGRLQGLEVPAAAWERFVLPARLRDFDPRHLDLLCLSGRLAWGRLSPRPASAAPGRAAPVALMQRADMRWLLAPSPAPDDLDPRAMALYDRLLRGGPAFTADLCAAVGGDATAADVEEALWTLVAGGWITADGFDALRRLVAPDTRRAPAGAGRWAVLRAPDRDPPGEVAGPFVDLLLRRYGVLFPDLLHRETHAPKWRHLLPELRRREARGTLRGGRFVGGFSGEQFALPAAVDALRGVRRRRPERPRFVRLSAADPLNLVGITSPGGRVPAVTDNAVLYRDGVPVAARVAGEHLTLADAGAGWQVDHDLRVHPVH